MLHTGKTSFNTLTHTYLTVIGNTTINKAIISLCGYLPSPWCCPEGVEPLSPAVFPEAVSTASFQLAWLMNIRKVTEFLKRQETHTESSVREIILVEKGRIL